MEYENREKIGKKGRKILEVPPKNYSNLITLHTEPHTKLHAVQYRHIHTHTPIKIHIQNRYEKQ